MSKADKELMEGWAEWLGMSDYKKKRRATEVLLLSGDPKLVKPMARAMSNGYKSEKSRRLLWEVMNPGLRQCTECGEVKILDPDTESKDWHNPQKCMSCRNKWRRSNAEKRKAKMTPAEKKAASEKNKAYQEAYKASGRHREVYEAYHEALKAKRAEDPEFDEAFKRKRREAHHAALSKRLEDPEYRAQYVAKQKEDRKQRWANTTQEQKDRRNKKRREERYEQRYLRDTENLWEPDNSVAPSLDTPLSDLIQNTKTN